MIKTSPASRLNLKKIFFRFFCILVAFFRKGVGVSKLLSRSPKKAIHFKIGLK